MSNNDLAGFNGPAIVEIMGHKRLAGYVTLATEDALTMVRIDTWNDGRPGRTVFYHPDAVFSISPVDEEVVQRAHLSEDRPLERWQIDSDDEIGDVDGQPF